MEQTSKYSISLTGLPIEILLDIYRHLDITSIYELSLVNRFFHDILAHRKASILLPVLAQEFSPFDELLQVYTASGKDLDSTSGSLYRPRLIVFKRHPTDSGTSFSPLKGHASATLLPGNSFTKVVKGGKPTAHSSSEPRPIILTERDLGPILDLCRVVRKWEELFPQMRWYHSPEDCRLLRPHEAERFRKAFYRWWLYGTYFHGDLPRPRIGLPEPQVDDIRTSQMRYHSTNELLELMDLVETMKDVILHYICPRLDPNPEHASHYSQLSELIDNADRQQSLADGWKDQSRWGRIVKTYAKLGPRELMHYFENIYSYPRKRLITDICLQNPHFTFDQESIQVAIRCALDERSWLAKVPSLAEDNCGGILDFDDERDDQRTVLSTDGSPDGSLPGGGKFTRSFSQYSPRGDDGSQLEEDYHYRQSSSYGRSTFWSSMGTTVRS